MVLLPEDVVAVLCCQGFHVNENYLIKECAMVRLSDLKIHIWYLKLPIEFQNLSNADDSRLNIAPQKCMD